MADWLTREQRSRNMAAIRSSGTKPEQKLGFLLEEMFPRRKIVPHPQAFIGKPDYELPSFRAYVFADGCFWHGCPAHGRVPEDNCSYWGPKITRNRSRDKLVNRTLRREGYLVIRVWDHELSNGMAHARAKIRRSLRRGGLIP